MNSIPFRWSALLTIPFLMACLQTRAQLRNDSEEMTQPAPTPVESKSHPGYAIEELKSEITVMNGRIEDLERAQKKDPEDPATTPSALAEEIKKLQARIEQLEQAKTEPAAAIDPESYFNAGREQMRSGNFEEAKNQFDLYLKGPKTKNTAEALFNRGEALFNLKKYKLAILDYSQITEKYRRSKFVPTALFRIGLSFEALGMKSDASAFYSELIEQHPKSPEAKSAKSKLKAISTHR